MTKKKLPTFSMDEKYHGHDNQIIKNHEKQITKLRSLIEQHEEKIRLIREDCTHEFKFWCSGMYEDTYYCSKCGESIEK